MPEKMYKNSNKLRRRVEPPKAGNTMCFDAGTSPQNGVDMSATPFTDTGGLSLSVPRWLEDPEFAQWG